MDNIGKPEVVTQKRVIDFFVNKLRYNYIGNLKDQANRNIALLLAMASLWQPRF